MGGLHAVSQAQLLQLEVSMCYRRPAVAAGRQQCQLLGCQADCSLRCCAGALHGVNTEVDENDFDEAILGARIGRACYELYHQTASGLAPDSVTFKLATGQPLPPRSADFRAPGVMIKRPGHRCVLCQLRTHAHQMACQRSQFFHARTQEQPCKACYLPTQTPHQSCAFLLLQSCASSAYHQSRGQAASCGACRAQ